MSAQPNEEVNLVRTDVSTIFDVKNFKQQNTLDMTRDELDEMLLENQEMIAEVPEEKVEIGEDLYERLVQSGVA